MPGAVRASPVTIELLGVARLLARREAVEVPVEGSVPLTQLLQRLGGELPALVGTVVTHDGALLGGHVLSRDGAELIRDADAPIHPGDRLLLLSTSAGG